MKNLLEDFNVKLGRENIFKLTIGNEIIYQDSNDNGVGKIKCDTSKNLIVKARHSCVETFINIPGTLWKGRLTSKLITY
jgi:hypothetical protein